MILPCLLNTLLLFVSDSVAFVMSVLFDPHDPCNVGTGMIVVF